MLGANFAGMMSAINRMNYAQMGQVNALDREMALMNRPVGLMFGAGLRDTFTRSAGNQQANLRAQTMMAVAEGSEKQARTWLKKAIDNWFMDFSTK